MDKESAHPDSVRRVLEEKFSLVITSSNGNSTGRHDADLGQTTANQKTLSTQMTDQRTPRSGTDEESERPVKRRRGGRRVTNPEMSAEERRRRRILKNRESAMRSLAKKAEYSAQLERFEKEAQEKLEEQKSALKKVLETALRLRASLDKVPEDVQELSASVDVCINRCKAAVLSPGSNGRVETNPSDSNAPGSSNAAPEHQGSN